MQAILTKVIPATNTKGTRIKATCAAGSLTLDYHAYDGPGGGLGDQEQRHAWVARKLAEKLGWTGHRYGELVTGCLPSGDYCHVSTEAVTIVRGFREMIREGRNNGNPWRNPEVTAMARFIAERDGKTMEEV